MLLSIRDQILTYAKAAFEAANPGIAVAWPGAPFDWNNPPELYVEFEILNEPGEQIGMSVNPKTRYYGHVEVTASGRKGTGNRRQLALCDWFITRFAYAYVGSITFGPPHAESPPGPTGWEREQVCFSFHVDG